jgi:hypothetical protein
MPYWYGKGIQKNIDLGSLLGFSQGPGAGRISQPSRRKRGDECKTDADCPPGKTCKEGRCIKKEEVRECITDANCPPGKICKEGRCIKKEEVRVKKEEARRYITDVKKEIDLGSLLGFSQGPGAGRISQPSSLGLGVSPQPVLPFGAIRKPGDECKTDNDCPPGKICKEGRCIKEEGVRVCITDADCPPGKTCKEGRCITRGVRCRIPADCPEGQTCKDGMCIAEVRPFPIPPSKKDCVQERDVCLQRCEGFTGNFEACKQTCQTAYQECIKSQPGNCPYGTGEAHSGCACGKKYPAKDQSQCVTGYVFIKKPNIPGYAGQCECSKWCMDIGYEADCRTKKFGTTIGQFQWPTELQELYNLLMGKGKEFLSAEYQAPTALGTYEYPAEMQELLGTLLGKGKEIAALPYGYTPEAISGMFGKEFEKIRGTERATRESLLTALGREGMLGTGAAITKPAELAWQTQGQIGNIQRDLLIANEAQKRDDMVTYTQAVQSLLNQGVGMEQIKEGINAQRREETLRAQESALSQYLDKMGMGAQVFGQGIGYSQIQEMINAARRGETTDWLKMLLNLLGIFKG